MKSFTHGVNVNYYKSVYHPIPIRENREHTGKERGRPFLEGPRRGATL